MSKTKNNVANKDIITLFEEMIDEMKKSVDNISDICQQQLMLIDIVDKAGIEKLKDFSDGAKTSAKDLLKQEKTLHRKINVLEGIVDLMKTDMVYAGLIGNLCRVFGIFNLTIDE